VFQLGKKGDITVQLPLTFAEAALGAKVEVPTLEEPVTLKIPAGTTSGRTFRVKGKGAPRSRGGHGDLLVKVEVPVPQKLSRREKQILEEFAKEHREDPRAHLQPYLKKTAPASQEG
jgi:molecular chaperone DnaJ